MQRLLTYSVGIVFIYAGISKLSDPLVFAHSLYSFNLFPIWFVALLSIWLPHIEISLGISLFIKFLRRAGLVLILILLVIFSIFSFISILLGLGEYHCNCFKFPIELRIRDILWIEILLFLLTLTLCLNKKNLI